MVTWHKWAIAIALIIIGILLTIFFLPEIGLPLLSIGALVFISIMGV